MSTVPLPPGRAYYIRIFSISLIIIVAALLGFLFGVRMEASVPASGILQARDQQNLRAPAAGLAELGWYEGQDTSTFGKVLNFRVDAWGNGLTDPGQGTSQPIQDDMLADGHSIKAAPRKFHALVVGDHLWPGQVLAWISREGTDDSTRPPLPASSDKNGASVPAPALASAAVRVPEKHALWQVLKIHVEPHAAVAAGAPIATVAPLDPATHEPVEVLALLEVAEEVSEEVSVGQAVRLYSSVFNPRLHGPAEGKLLSIDPLAEPHADGKRYFQATAAVLQSPFPLRLGSSVSAKIILGRKSVYRIILEH